MNQLSTAQIPVDSTNPLLQSLRAENKCLLDSLEFTRLLQYLSLDSCKSERKQYHDCLYVNYKQQGISFCFDRVDNQLDILAAIHIFASSNSEKTKKKQEYSEFQQFEKLPYQKISQKLTIRDVIMKFAPEEPQKGGGSRELMNVWLKYHRFGIEFSFPTRDWEDPNVCWSEIVLFQPKE